MNQWVNERIHGGMIEPLLCWATSSLSHSEEVPLVSATSSLGRLFFFPDPALSCLLANSSVASAAQFFSSRSWYNVVSNLQLQSRLPEASQHHSRFAARSRANCVLSQPVAKAHRRSVAPIRAASRVQTFPCYFERGYFLIFIQNRALATVWCTFCRPHLPKVARACSEKQILTKTEIWLQSCALFCRHRAPPPRKQRPYFGNHITRNYRTGEPHKSTSS